MTIVLNAEILMLMVLAGITLLAYMVAINAHGPIRLALSYLMATMLLTGTVLVVVQYVNNGIEQRKNAEIQRLAQEKQKVEETVVSQRAVISESRETLAMAGKLNTIITRGAAMASSMVSLELQDRSANLETLIARANEANRRAKELKAELDKLGTVDPAFATCLSLMDAGIGLLSEASYYYRNYYYSEDSAQEDLRARVMRQKAKAAYEKFQQASTFIASMASTNP